MGFSSHFFGADKIHLPFDFVQRPVSFTGMQEVNAQTRYHLASIALLLPVEGKWIEMVAPEIHHGVYLVLDTFAQPALHILINRVERIPSSGRITAGVAIFTHRAGAHLHPRFYLFYLFIYITQDFRQVVASPLGEASSIASLPVIIGIGESAGFVGITEKVEMHAIHIVALHHLAHQAHQVFFGFRMPGVEVIMPPVGEADVGMPFRDRLFPQGLYVLAVSQREGDHPSMAFHSPFVAFFHSESQGVIAGVPISLSCQYGIHRLDVRTVEHIPPGTCLEEDGIEMGGLQFVQQLDEFSLLAFLAGGRCGADMRPVQSVCGSNPCCTHFVFGLGGSG